MSLKDDLKAEVTRIFKSGWSVRDGKVVPSATDLKLDNDGIQLEGTVLYADLDASTSMVESKAPKLAAEVYKVYLHCAAKIIRSNDGEITAYDGDRVMAVFLGTQKNTSAVKCGLQINWAVQELINPAFKAQYPGDSLVIGQVVGIDTSSLLVARTGVRGDNDLVWVGRAANYAAKLSQFDASFPTWITTAVFDAAHESVRTTNGTSMWEARSWTNMANIIIHRSNWRWPIE